MASPLQIGPGTRIGNLLVERELGRGGFAAVYLARDLLIDRLVALKVLDAGGPDIAAQEPGLLAEARIVGALDSPHIVTLHAVREIEVGRFAFEMEFIDGGSLADTLRDGTRVPHPRATEILRGVLLGLRAAHARGILHRDVKPANVLLTRTGGAKLADFGLAHWRDPETPHDAPQGIVTGTPWYMPPEMLLREPLSAPSDLWSVGVVAYEMVAGRVPFPQADIADLFFAIVNSPAPRLPTDVPVQLAVVIERCLAKKREDRFASCDELLQALERTSGAIRLAARVPSQRSGFVGRAVELARCAEVLEEVAAGASRILHIIGESGIGKSALLDEVRSAAQGLGFAWIGVAASPVEGPLQLLISAARATLSAAHRREWNTADDPQPHFGSATPVVDEWMAGRTPLQFSDPAQVAWALEHLMLRLRAEQPIVICVDDAHDLQAGDASLIDGLARRLDGGGFLFIYARRRGPHAETLSEPRISSTLVLSGLAREEIYALLERSAAARLPPEIATQIADRSDGNPLIGIEILRCLEEAGAVVREGDELCSRPGWDAVAVPKRLHDLIAARLQSLSEEDRSLLDSAAIDGSEFDGQAIAAATGKPLLDCLRSLQRLARQTQLVATTSTGFRFTSTLVRHVIEEDLGPELRVELHRRLAESLESRPTPADPARRARHWSGCGRSDRAGTLWIDAADAAARCGDDRRTFEFAGRGQLELRIGDNGFVMERAELLLQMARDLGEGGRSEQGTELLAALERAALANEDERLLLRTRVTHALVIARTKGLKAVDSGLLRRAADAFPGSVLAERALSCLGLLYKGAGRTDEAERMFKQAEAIAVRLGTEHRHAVLLDQLGSLAKRRGDLDEAERIYAEASALARRIGRPAIAAISEVNAAACSIERGRLEGTDEVLDRAIRAFEVAGQRGHAAQARVMLSDLYFALGKITAAQEATELAVVELRETGPIVGLATALARSAEMLGMQGRIDEAETAISEARALAARAGDRRVDAMVSAQATVVHCMSCRFEDAAVSFRHCLHVAREIESAAGIIGPPLIEAVLLGLDAPSANDALRFIELARNVEPALAEVAVGVRFLLEGLHNPEALRSASRCLGSGPATLGRPSAKAIEHWLGAAAERQTNGDEAVKLEVSAIDAAEAVGHVWLQVGILQWSGQATARERISRLIERSTSGCALDSFERVRTAWTAVV